MTPDYPKEYLPINPWSVVVHLLNKKLDTDYPDDICVLAAKDLIGDDIIEVSIAIDHDEGLSRFLPPTEFHTVCYRRLPIQETVGPITMMYPSVHYHTVVDMLTEIISRYPNYGLTTDDFVITLIPPGVSNHVITTDRYSLRWYGNLEVSFPRR